LSFAICSVLLKWGLILLSFSCVLYTIITPVHRYTCDHSCPSFWIWLYWLQKQTSIKKNCLESCLVIIEIKDYSIIDSFTFNNYSRIFYFTYYSQFQFALSVLQFVGAFSHIRHFLILPNLFRLMKICTQN